MQKMCQSQQLSVVTRDRRRGVHGIQASVTLLSPRIVDDFFSLELELGTYINLYSFESSIERPFRDIFSFRLNKNFGLRRTGRASRTHALQKSLHKP